MEMDTRINKPSVSVITNNRNVVTDGGTVILYGFGNKKIIMKIGKHLSIALDKR